MNEFAINPAAVILKQYFSIPSIKLFQRHKHKIYRNIFTNANILFIPQAANTVHVTLVKKSHNGNVQQKIAEHFSG